MGKTTLWPGIGSQQASNNNHAATSEASASVATLHVPSKTATNTRDAIGNGKPVCEPERGDGNTQDGEGTTTNTDTDALGQ